MSMSQLIFRHIQELLNSAICREQKLVALVDLQVKIRYNTAIGLIAIHFASPKRWGKAKKLTVLSTRDRSEQLDPRFFGLFSFISASSVFRHH
jgi:hypothetical protein